MGAAMPSKRKGASPRSQSANGTPCWRATMKLTASSSTTPPPANKPARSGIRKLGDGDTACRQRVRVNTVASTAAKAASRKPMPCGAGSSEANNGKAASNPCQGDAHAHSRMIASASNSMAPMGFVPRPESSAMRLARASTAQGGAACSLLVACVHRVFMFCMCMGSICCAGCGQPFIEVEELPEFVGFIALT